MEPRKGVQRRLAPKAKRTSAALAALVLAALLALSGCGGDSDSSDAQTASTPVQAPAKQTGSNTSKPTAQGKAAKAKADASTPSSKAQGAGGGGKQSQAVPLPTDDSGLERGPTPQEEAEATIADMTLTSPALIGPEAILPSQYTCEGKDTWPTLQWGGTPEGTEELILFAMNSQPVEDKLFFDWAVAGIDPDTVEIEEGRLPPGAISGRNSYGQSGYSLCPAKGTSETFIFALFALPERLSPAKGFDPAQVRREVLDVSGNVGLLAVSYRR